MVRQYVRRVVQRRIGKYLNGEGSPNLVGIHAAAPVVAQLVPFL